MRSLLFILLFVTGSVDHVTVNATPKIGMAPTNVRVQCRIPRRDNNRWLKFGLDGEEFSRFSTVQLDGADAPTMHETVIAKVPCGHYRAVCILEYVGGNEQDGMDVELKGFGCEGGMQ